MSIATVELSSVCRMDRRTAPASGALGQGLEFVGMENVDPETGQIAPGQGSRSGEGKGQAFLFDDRHVLFGKLRPYLRKIALPRQPGCASTELVPLLPDATRLDRSYLFHWVRRQPVIDALMAKNTGARMPRADMSVLLDMLIPLPPLEEQRRIVSLLDRAAEIRRRADDARTKARAIVPALFLDMFGDPASNPKEWSMTTLGKITDSSTGTIDPRRSPDDTFDYIDIGSIDVAMKSITEPKQICGRDAPSRARKRVAAGDVVVSMTRPNLNAVAVVGDSYNRPVASTGLAVLRPLQCTNTAFIISVATSRYFVEQLSARVAGGLYPAVTESKVRSLPIFVPPFPLQTVFSDQAQRFEATARALDAAAGKAELMAAALSSEVFG